MSIVCTSEREKKDQRKYEKKTIINRIDLLNFRIIQ